MEKNFDFGTNLKVLREGRNLTRLDFAKALGINYTTLTNYENNKREPRIYMLKHIAGYFKISVDCLVGTVKNYNAAERRRFTQIAKQLACADFKLIFALACRLADKEKM